MKILRNPGFCRITFEGNERFAGKKLRVDGDKLENGFGFYPSTFGWYEKSEEGGMKIVPVDDEIRRDLSEYIIDCAEKEGYVFIQYVLPGEQI